MFSIDIDAVRCIVRSVVSGFLDEAEAQAYVTTLEQAFARQIGCQNYVILIDVSQARIQSQSVFAIFDQHVQNFPRAHRIAIVNGCSASRMQMRRLLRNDYTAIFEGRDEAEAWLLAGWTQSGDAQQAA